LTDEQFDQPGSIDQLIGADFSTNASIRQKDTPWQLPSSKETVLCWTLSGRTPDTTTQHDPQHTFLLREDSRLEHNLNSFWEVESVEQSTMTKEQQAYEQHFISHKPNKQMEDLLPDCQQKWIPSNLVILASLQSADYMQLNADWNENQNSRFNCTIS